MNEKKLSVAVVCSIIPALMAGGALAEDSTAVARGKTLFTQTCSVCHGPDGKGAGRPSERQVNLKVASSPSQARVSPPRS